MSLNQGLPQNEHDENSDPDVEIPSKKLLQPIKKTSRAKSLVELQNRIDKLKKKNNTYKEKLQKRNLKNRLKKKIKQEKRSTVQKVNTVSKQYTEETDKKPERDIHQTQPVFNKEDKIIFSKIDFAGVNNKKHKKLEGNPKKILDDVQQINNKLQQLEELGEIGKATEIKRKTSWKNALAKAQAELWEQLATQAFINVSKDIEEQQAIRIGLHKQCSKAPTHALEFEAAKKPSKAYPNIRELQVVSEGETLRDINNKVDQLEEKFGKPSGQLISKENNRKNQACWNCDSHGHITLDCRTTMSKKLYCSRSQDQENQNHPVK
ncbi:putative surfeit locus protein 6 [Trypoxylus dichotomus]